MVMPRIVKVIPKGSSGHLDEQAAEDFISGQTSDAIWNGLVSYAGKDSSGNPWAVWGNKQAGDLGADMITTFLPEIMRKPAQLLF